MKMTSDQQIITNDNKQIRDANFIAWCNKMFIVDNSPSV